MPRLTTLAPRLGTLAATYLLFTRSFMRQEISGGIYMNPHQFLVAVSAVLIVSTAAHAEPPKAAVFDFQLANLGAQTPTDEDQARLGPLTDLLRQQLQESGRYQIVSTDPVRAEVEKFRPAQVRRMRRRFCAQTQGGRRDHWRDPEGLQLDPQYQRLREGSEG
jgi:hypothetical protein